MNDKHDSPDAVELDELHDRLTDRALTELVGGDRPPDMAERILAAAAAPDLSHASASATDVSHAAAPSPDHARSGPSRRELAIAASVLVLLAAGFAVLLVPRTHRPESGPVAVLNDRSQSMSVAAPAGRSPSDMCYTVAKPVYESPPAGSTVQLPFISDPMALDNGKLAKSGADTESLSGANTYSGATTISAGTLTVNKASSGRHSQLGDLITETTEPSTWDPTGARSVKPFPGNMNLVLGQAQAVHDDIALRDLRLDRGEQVGQVVPDQTEQGQGPGMAGDRYRRIVENMFLASLSNPLSTFAIDVDTASYSNVRQFIMQQGTLPPPDAVRIEELINYFHYGYAEPTDGRPFAVHVEVADCPWQPQHRLVRIALKGREISTQQRPRANLVFLIDVSGSMDSPERLPLLVRGLKLLSEQLRNDDQVSIVVYAGNEGLVLPTTPGSNKRAILAALDKLEAGGPTNGGAGIQRAYKIAQQNFIPDGINRVILCTDGDFNVGTTSDAELERLVEDKAKDGTYLTLLGFGRGNLNDGLLKAFSKNGKGNYFYIDNISEARKVLVEQMTGTIMTIAKDVKIQVEFNPARVAGFRLLGYEDRILSAEDFNNDKKDGGQVGSGHTVTALYELVPAGKLVENAPVDALKYQTLQKLNDAAKSGEMMTVKLRYKDPDAQTSKLLEVPVQDDGRKFGKATSDFQFAAAVAEFGLLLRDSKYKGTATYDSVLEIAMQNRGDDVQGYRNELTEIVRRSQQLAAAKKR